MSNGPPAKRARGESSLETPSSLTDAVLLNIFNDNPEKRKLIISALQSTDTAQASVDQGCFIKFNPFMELMDAATSSDSNNTEKVITKCKALNLPVSENLKRTRFHEECVEIYGRSGGTTPKNKVRFQQYITMNKAPDGRKWYIYLATNEESITHVVKYATEKLAIPDDQIRRSPIDMPGVVQICFRDPSVPPTPPTMVAVEDDEED